MSLKYFLVDVFAEERYTGNQLAVIIGNPPTPLMQRLALEMNLSETTFVTSTQPENSGYNVRIFTKQRELPFAGHPTLGTAYILQREILRLPAKQVNLNLGVGQIPVTFDQDDLLWMQQKPVQFGHIHDPDEIAQILNLRFEDIDPHYPIQDASTGNPHIIVPVKTLDALKRVDVDVPRFRSYLLDIDSMPGANAFCVFTPETYFTHNDFNVRTFGHLRSVPEDPATGSAIGNLAGYLAHHEYFGTSSLYKLRVEQGYEINRPSLLLFSVERQHNQLPHEIRNTPERGLVISVGGKVRLVARGELV